MTYVAPLGLGRRGLSPSYRHVAPLGLNAPNPLSRFTPSILKISDKIGMQVSICRDSENRNLIRTIIMSPLIGSFNSPIDQSPSRGYGGRGKMPRLRFLMQVGIAALILYMSVTTHLFLVNFVPFCYNPSLNLLNY